MRTSYDWVHRFNLLLGAMLLLSSGLVVPISGSAAYHGSSKLLPIEIGELTTSNMKIKVNLPPSLEESDRAAELLTLLAENGLVPIPNAVFEGPMSGQVPPGPILLALRGTQSADPVKTSSLLSEQVISQRASPVEVSAQGLPLVYSTGAQVSNAQASGPGGATSSQAGGSAWGILVNGQNGLVSAAPSPQGGVGSAQSLAISQNGQVVVFSYTSDSPPTIFPGSNTIQFTAAGNPSASSLQYYAPTTSLVSVTSALPSMWLDSSKRRSKSQIYVEILELMKRGPMTPFEIAFYARLNHKRAKEYVEFLKHSGYLETDETDGKVIYVLSKEGITFLEHVKMLFQQNQSQSTQYANYGYNVKDQ
jgi:predicted transcriptional regulator